MASGADVPEERATGVIRASLEPVPGDHRVLGGLMVFCAGCVLALGARLAEGGAAIAAGQDGVPFLCMFAFGEQGSFVNGCRQHGNPMISNTLFSAPPERANHVARP